MLRRSRLELACLVAVLVLAARGGTPPLLAQEPRPGLEVAPSAGLLAFDQNFLVSDGPAFRDLKDAAVLGARLGYTVSRRFGVEGSIGFSSQSLDPSSDPLSSGLDVTYASYVGEALVYLTSGNVLPFLAAGLGGASLDVKADAGPDESSSGLVASLGGGLKIPLTPSLLVRVDGRDFVVRQEGGRRVSSVFGGDGDLRHNIGLSAGLAFRFGGPGDEDQDGVYDDRDTCPGTEPGLPVDERGCVPEVPEGPPPVKTDVDGDGVSDALDRCPDTPRGAVVDLEGCPVEGTPEGEAR